MVDFLSSGQDWRDTNQRSLGARLSLCGSSWTWDLRRRYGSDYKISSRPSISFVWNVLTSDYHGSFRLAAIVYPNRLQLGLTFQDRSWFLVTDFPLVLYGELFCFPIHAIRASKCGQSLREARLTISRRTSIMIYTALCTWPPRTIISSKMISSLSTWSSSLVRSLREWALRRLYLT